MNNLVVKTEKAIINTNFEEVKDSLVSNLEKYKGVIPAFYACYDKDGNVSPEGVQALTRYFVEKGVKGVYVNGSSGECIYQSVEDRKIILENVIFPSLPA